MNIWIINGPNLNLLGSRQVSIYGDRNLDDLETYLTLNTQSLDMHLSFFQSNHEGALIDCLHRAHQEGCDGILINAGALSHYSYALYDAILAITPDVIEIHLSDPKTREEAFRHTSVIENACIKTFSGKGFDSYLNALVYLKGRISL